MIREFVNKVIKKLREADAEESKDTLKRLSKKVAPSNKDAMSETLYWLDRIKNSVTVKTGEFEALTQLYTGQKMYVDTRDVSLVPHVMFEGIWEEGISKLVQQIVQPDDVFFDVGANFGYYSFLVGTKLERKGTQIHIFEANPDLTPYLEKSLSVNGLTAISTIIQKAVADKPGKVRLNRITNLWGGSTLNELEKLKEYRPVEDTFDKHFDVEAITLDDYIAKNKVKRVSLIKIDVEGVEDRVYSGMSELIKKNRDLRLMLEFTFGAYKDERGFFNKLANDFKHIYVMTDEGKLKDITSFKEMKESTNYELVMLLLAHEHISIK